jgi:hypothetical protein
MDKIARNEKEEQETRENTLIEERKARREKLKSELLMQKRIAKRKKRTREKLEEKYKKELLIGKGEYVPDPEPEPVLENSDEPAEGILS